MQVHIQISQITLSEIYLVYHSIFPSLLDFLFSFPDFFQIYLQYIAFIFCFVHSGNQLLRDSLQFSLPVCAALLHQREPRLGAHLSGIVKCVCPHSKPLTIAVILNLCHNLERTCKSVKLH